MPNFQEDLAFSESPEVEAFIQTCCEHFFPDKVLCQRCTGNTAGQHLGHDRVVYLSTGKVILIDEKIDATDNPNFAMEYIANDRAKGHSAGLGWIEKPMQIDYVLYVFLQYPRKAYLLPWEILRASWEKNKAKWLESYGSRSIYNELGRYSSMICPVPRLILLESLALQAAYKE